MTSTDPATSAATPATKAPWRLVYLVSHPIQYQAPLLRLIAADPAIDLMVLFEDPRDSGGSFDAGFGRDVAWDVPLTDGYDHAPASRDSLRRHLASADALWMHGWDTGLKRWALGAARRHGIATLMRGENMNAAMPDGPHLRGFLKRRYLDWIFARCSGFLCIGSDNRQYYIDRGVEAARLHPMPYAVDNDFFKSRCAEAAANRDAFRADLGLAPKRPVILYAGKLQRRKNPLTLLDAFNTLDTETCRNPYLLYVGDGEERPALEAALKDMDADRQDSIRLLGFRNQTELPAFYDLADIFVLASRAEPWGLAVNEAMCGAAAVIVTDECGCAADLVTQENGRIVAPGDAPDLARALTDLLADQTALAAAGQAARQAVDKCSFAADIEGLKQALQAVCPKPRVDT